MGVSTPSPKRRRRWLWLLAALPLAAIASQCTPVPGCWNEHTFTQGRHLGFSIGMNRREALRVVERTYDPAAVSIWTGGNNLIFAKSSKDISVLSTPFEQWRFRQPKPICWSVPHNVVLQLADGRLEQIKDELDVTWP